MSNSKCRWGILSTASIARKNWKAILKTGNAIVTAVASRDESRSLQYIKENQADSPFDEAPEAFGSYEALLASDRVDAVYIPLPTGLRKEWVIKAAEAGKHVMCEKPCAINAQDLEEMITACDKAGVQFMDGVMFMHSKRMPVMRTVLDDGEVVGDIKRITAQFSFCAPEEFFTDNIRMHSGLEPMGALGDLGWYTSRISLWAMNYEMPREVTARMLSSMGRVDSPDSVPTELSAELIWNNGVSGSFYNSFLTENQQLVHISGSKGFLTLDDFVLPFYGHELEFETNNSEFWTKGCKFVMEAHKRQHLINEFSEGEENSQEANLFRCFSNYVLEGEVDNFWPEVALKTQKILDACLESARNGGKAVTLA
ncbi:Gfo/Idh/MocA family oxidoreductase [Verrucomicrobia bacterium]|nr:Gfo/Idh/MocA family oxidoreductase [Verrucomicrobiota bacterium]